MNEANPVAVQGITSPHGLHIPVTANEEASIRAMQESIDVRDALLNAELWASMPGSVASVTAVVVAVLTGSIGVTVAASVVGYLLARVATQFFFSQALATLVAQLLGAWFVAIPASLGAAWLLRERGLTALAVVQFGIVLVGGHWGLLEFTTPVVGPLMRPYWAERGAFLGSVQRDARERGLEFTFTRALPDDESAAKL